MSAPPLFHLKHGDGALVVSIPHAGTWLPAEIAAVLAPVGRRMVDTDWHVDRLYEFVTETDATLIVATHSRTVVDLNRGPDGAKLYPGQAETGICPTETFSGEPLYATGEPLYATGEPLYANGAPDPAARMERVAIYWQPYHAALASALARAHARHGYARLLDAHSIRGRVPRLFEGALPDLNFGTNGGAACSPPLARRAVQAADASVFSQALDGRFKGGYITRHYGRPAAGVDAIQLELAQRTYMDEGEQNTQEPAFDAARAAELVAVLRRLVAELSRR